MFFTRRGFLNAAAAATAASTTKLKPEREPDRGPAPAAPPAPVLKEFELAWFFVAGFRFHHGPDLLSNLEAGGRLVLVREPHNPHDPRAVALFHQGLRIGYVPRDQNATIAGLLDQKARLTCRMARVDREAEPWKAVEAVVTVHGAKALA